MNDKTTYNPQIHHRRSIRLKGYDYSQAGAYFITICVKDKACLFGNIVDDVMMLNEAGIMIDKWWQKVPEKFPDIEISEYQIMPNHFHAILINVGADPRVRPVSHEADKNDTHHVGADPRVRPHSNRADNTGTDDINSPTILGEHVGSPLQRVIQWFKTMSTNEYIRNVKTNDWPPFNGKLFQRDYYEHIIRNEESFSKIVDYIRNNPANWNSDKFYSG